MIRNTIETDEHGMFMNRERVEKFFLMMGQVAQIEAITRKEYESTGGDYKSIASVKCKDLAEILGIELFEEEDILDFSNKNNRRKDVF